MISVVVPCLVPRDRADEVGQQAWYTLASIEMALDGLDHEIVVVANGDYPMAASFNHDSKNVRVVFAGPAVRSPQEARNFGAAQTAGEWLFFIDAHVLVPGRFFEQVIEDMKWSGADFMGTPHKFQGRPHYGCRLAWNEFLWDDRILFEPPLGDWPWMAAVHPHGAFCVKRDAWDAVGGYWRALKGWGGEETQLCLKLWLMGRSVWATPRTIHWHWLPAGGRRTADVFGEEQFARNFLLVAAAYGDEERVRKSYRSLRALHWHNKEPYPNLAAQVLESREVANERAVVAARGKFKNLEELKTFWDANGVEN